jgi:hypothetical protein
MADYCVTGVEAMGFTAVVTGIISENCLNL